MSIILKGIDMPIETDYLRLALFRSGRDSEVLVFDDATNTLIGEAIQIPKGHGRLIDGDELKADIHMNRLNKYATKRDVDVTYKAINDAPTILEEEE